MVFGGREPQQGHFDNSIEFFYNHAATYTKYRMYV
jgi:hypothetical protein